MISFVTVLFIAVTWLGNGTVDQTFSTPQASMEQCIANKLQFDAEMTTAQSGAPPTLAPTFYSDCRAVSNTSAAKHI